MGSAAVYIGVITLVVVLLIEKDDFHTCAFFGCFFTESDAGNPLSCWPGIVEIVSEFS
jgi:hypothetical protein